MTDQNTPVARARAFAIAAHSAVGQVRKYTGEPYWRHCEQVGALLAAHVQNCPAEMIAAAWLHDTVEDTKVTLDIIRQEFGPCVATLVEGLTDVSRPEDGNRAARKALDREHTATQSPACKTVKLADLISNTRSIVDRDPEFARVYLREKELLLEVLREGDPTLWRIADDLVRDSWGRL